MGTTFFSALAISWLFAEVIIKRMVARVRPCHKIEEENLILKKVPKFYSFPSSHSATSFAMCAVSFYLCDTWVTLIIFVIALGISFSRFYLQAHYMTDVVCGIVLGIIRNSSSKSNRNNNPTDKINNRIKASELIRGIFVYSITYKCIRTSRNADSRL